MGGRRAASRAPGGGAALLLVWTVARRAAVGRQPVRRRVLVPRRAPLAARRGARASGCGAAARSASSRSSLRAVRARARSCFAGQRRRSARSTLPWALLLARRRRPGRAARVAVLEHRGGLRRRGGRARAGARGAGRRDEPRRGADHRARPDDATRARARSAARSRRCGDEARAMRRALAAVLMLAGVLLLADAALTLAWQEPVSALAAHRDQPRLRARAARARRSRMPAPSGAPSAAPRRPRARGRCAARTRDGDAVGRLRIPRLGLDAVVVRGTRPGRPEQAPGLFDAAPLPGERGHRADRRAPHDLRRAVPPHRPPAPRRPDHGDDALRDVPLRASRARGSSTPARPLGRFERSATPRLSCPPVIRCIPPLVASSSSLRRSA